MPGGASQKEVLHGPMLSKAVPVGLCLLLDTKLGTTTPKLPLHSCLEPQGRTASLALELM